MFQDFTPYFFSAGVVWFGFLWLRPFLHVMKLRGLVDVLRNPVGTYCLHPRGWRDLSSNPRWHNPEAHNRKSHCRVNVKTSNSLELNVDVKLFKAASTVLWSQRSADFYSRIYSSRLTWELQWPCMGTACGQIVLAQLFSGNTAMDCNDWRVVKGNLSHETRVNNAHHQNHLLKDKKWCRLTCTFIHIPSRKQRVFCTYLNSSVTYMAPRINACTSVRK
jgi:hypothetical protein